jgi:hypothetical protein
MSPRLSFSEWRGPLHEARGRLSGAFTKLEGDLSTRKLAQGDTWLERGHAAPIGVIDSLRSVEVTRRELRPHSGQDAHCTMESDGVLGGVGFQPAQGRPHSGQDAHCTNEKPGQLARNSLTATATHPAVTEFSRPLTAHRPEAR